MNAVAVSNCGHDKDRCYIVLYTEGNFAYLADGRCKKLSKPKRKNVKHLTYLQESVDLDKYNPLYDAHILKELKSVLKKGGCCLG